MTNSRYCGANATRFLSRAAPHSRHDRNPRCIRAQKEAFRSRTTRKRYRPSGPIAGPGISAVASLRGYAWTLCGKRTALSQPLSLSPASRPRACRPDRKDAGLFARQAENRGRHQERQWLGGRPPTEAASQSPVFSASHDDDRATNRSDDRDDLDPIHSDGHDRRDGPGRSPGSDGRVRYASHNGGPDRRDGPTHDRRRGHDHPLRARLNCQCRSARWGLRSALQKPTGLEQARKRMRRIRLTKAVSCFLLDARVMRSRMKVPSVLKVPRADGIRVKL